MIKAKIFLESEFLTNFNIVVFIGKYNTIQWFPKHIRVEIESEEISILFNVFQIMPWLLSSCSLLFTETKFISEVLSCLPLEIPALIHSLNL